jgi:DegV family protein with EDD domain
MASPEEYYLALRKYAEEGYDIISMTLSSKISGTYSVSVKAAERVKEDFPERRIYCFDSLRMSGSFGLLTAYASRMCAEGKSFDEVVEWLEENKHRVHQMGPIDDLTFIARRGKISSGKAFMGNLMGIKPMGDSNTDGYVSVLSKAKGIKKALLATAEYVAKLSEDIENNYVIISHSNRENLALELRDMIIERSHPKEVLVTDVFAGCGTNIGPGMISVYFFGEEISSDLSKEKEALTLAIGQ